MDVCSFCLGLNTIACWGFNLSAVSTLWRKLTDDWRLNCILTSRRLRVNLALIASLEFLFPTSSLCGTSPSTTLFCLKQVLEIWLAKWTSFIKTMSTQMKTVRWLLNVINAWQKQWSRQTQRCSIILAEIPTWPNAILALSTTNLISRI